MSDSSLSPALGGGDATAEEHFALGLAYYRGTGIQKDLALAIECFRKAAELGHANGQYSLGYAYDHGESVQANRQTALDWYLRAANQGHADAQCSLGYAYYKGDGVAKNLETAVEWYQMAFAGNSAEAMYSLGCMYDIGEGVPLDPEMAESCFQSGADFGHPHARYKLGLLYESGRGVEQDYERAAGLFRGAYEGLQGRSTMKTLIAAMVIMAAAGTNGVAQAAQSKHAPADVRAGHVAWFDVTATNLPNAQKFYAKVFGWQFTPVAGTKLAVEIVASGEPIGTLRVSDGKIGAFNGVVYIQVDDIQAACGKVRSAGGKIEAGFPFNLPDGKGAIALAKDPSQHPIGMYSRRLLPVAPASPHR